MRPSTAVKPGAMPCCKRDEPKLLSAARSVGGQRAGAGGMVEGERVRATDGDAGLWAPLLFESHGGSSGVAISNGEMWW